MAIVNIFIISGCILFLGVLINKKRGGVIKKDEKLVLSLSPILFMALTLLVSDERISGTIQQVSYGWPKTIFILLQKDIIDNEIMNQIVVSKPLSFVFSYLFYFALIFLVFEVVKTFSSKKSAV